MADPKKSSVPELGMFYGDQGGPGVSLPSTDAHKLCPFLDKREQTFCTLDGALCPFVGFNYRRCKKYTNNMAKGALVPMGATPAADKPPRLESLVEAAKKGGPATEEDLDKELKKLEGKDIKSALFATFATQLGLMKDEGASPEEIRAAEDEIHQQMLDIGIITPPVIKGKKKLPGETVKDHQARLATEKKKIDAQKRKIEQMEKLVYAYNNRVLGAKDDSGRKANVQAAAKDLFAFANMSVQQGVPDISWYHTRQHNLRYHDAGNTEDLFFHKYGEELKGTPTSQSTEEPDTRPHTPRKGPKKGYASKAFKGPKPLKSRAGESQAKAKNSRDAKEKAERSQFQVKSYRTRKPKTPKEKTQQTEKSTPTFTVKRHESGLPQTSTKVRTAEQFKAWADELSQHYSKATLEAVFRGEHDSVGENINKFKKTADDLYQKNDVEAIAKMKTWLDNKLKDFDDIEHKKQIFDRDFEENKRRARILDPHVDEKLKAWRTDPERLTKLAEMQNKMTRKLYRLEHQKTKIGNSEVIQTIRKATMPKMTRSDFEVIRMSEQLGLAAIQKQHQYGRKYGIFNTWVLFARDVLMPMIVSLMGAGHAQYVPILKSLWPQAFLDSFFFAHVDKPLPKYKTYGGKDDGLVMSRDDKSMISQRMVSGRGKRLMRGFDKDYVMPPDRAVLHTQWRPTTKKPWSKIRNKELAKRYQAVKNTAMGHAETWRRGFLRR